VIGKVGEAEFREERMLWMVCRRTTLSPACHAFMKIIKAEVKAVSKAEMSSLPSAPSSRQKKRRHRSRP